MDIVKGILMGILAGLSVYDLKTKKVPVSVVVLAGIGGIVYRLYMETKVVVLLAGLVPGVVLLLLAFLTKESIGIGDGMVLCVIGLLCGWKETVAILGMALVFAAIIAVILLVSKRVGRKTLLPFLPCLCAGYLLVVLG